MDALVERLDAKLRQWKPDTADQVRQRVAELIHVPWSKRYWSCLMNP